MTKFFLLTLICYLVAATALAQNSDFTGTWQLKDQKGISGTLYSNGVPKQIKLSQTKDTLTYQSTNANAQGQDVTTTENLSFKGQPFEGTTSSKRKKTVTLKWSKDGKILYRTSDLSQVGDTTKAEIRYSDSYTMEGEKLILQRKAENFSNGEVWESWSLYEKVK